MGPARQKPEPSVDLKRARELGLEEREYEKILELLGRTPTYTELGIYSVMWSEHCSYKHSILELKKLPRTGARLLVGGGEENAGLVDIGDGLAIAFKIESHNHPSAVEPYQGAATGVGGIMRDIFTMGARPVAALNSLRFGDPGNPRTRYLARGIVRGIGNYGNSFGIPTVAGDTYFEECFGDNPLVNAMAVGVVRHRDFVRARASGAGNLVMIVGSSTGRDGIHGATFASEEISAASEVKRPSVQVGDPFTEKLLLEATLEAIQAGCIVGIQDMGAAGITCSTSEMSAKGGVGMTIDLDSVPVREEGMSAYEIMLSESQERMLIVTKPGDEERARSIFRKWDLECRVIGQVTGEPRLRISHGGKLVADVPPVSLVLGGGAPVYEPESRQPAYVGELRKVDLAVLPEPRDYNRSLLELLSSPNIASRRWISTQYDSMVGNDTIVSGGADAAVVRIDGSRRAIALKTDCNPRYVFLNPYVGAQIAVAECARNVACVGARPIAITNCLNFGNPKKPEMFWQFKEAVRGIGDACTALETPVTGGNVSFYNESPDGPIYPSPVIGMLGLIEDARLVVRGGFQHQGDQILLLGHTVGHIGGSEYLKVIHSLVAGDAPPIDLGEEKRLEEALLALCRAGLLQSAHDLSEGGIAIALAESCLFATDPGSMQGARINLERGSRDDYTLFGEDQSRVLISVAPAALDEVQSVLAKFRVKSTRVGSVGGPDLVINDRIRVSVSEMGEVYESALEKRLGIEAGA
ncbi:MAG TPA: phosphoribosylformylglycinamidine synthase subunit PurL [Bacteroidota bacterium]|jgi:phosphoribosylformylglycinamidine synthase